MRLMAYSPPDGGEAQMGALEGDVIAPLGSVDRFYANLAAFDSGSVKNASDRISKHGVRVAVPVPRSARILCAGLNYHSHAAETKNETPGVPDVFGRWRSTLVAHQTVVPIPPRDSHFDWEGELAVIVGTTLHDVTPAEALRGIFGYTCFNDLTARQFQFAGHQMTLGKNADQSGPIGPYIVTPDEVDHARSLRIETTVNGSVEQTGNSRDLIFDAADIVSYASGCMTLMPGDVIATGTPAGVGFSQSPPKFLTYGDCVTVSIEGLGALTNRIGAS